LVSAKTEICRRATQKNLHKVDLALHRRPVHCFAVVINVAYLWATHTELQNAVLGWAISAYAVPQQGEWPCLMQAHVRPLRVFAGMTNDMKNVSACPGFMGEVLKSANCGVKASSRKQPRGPKSVPVRKRGAQGKNVKAEAAPSEQASRKRKAKELGTGPQRVRKKVCWRSRPHL
jgi:hypothetical protein